MRFLALLCAAALFGAGAPAAQAQSKPLCVLSASPAAVTLGATTNLSWTSINATGGSITSIGSVEPKGTQGVIPTAPGVTYVGTFTGPGGTATCSVHVAVVQGGGNTVQGDTAGGAAQDNAGAGTANQVQSVDGSSASSLSNSSSVNTQSNTSPSVTGTTAGIVPCSGVECQACHLVSLGQNIINWVVGITLVLAVAGFVYSGILYFTSAVNPKQRIKAKNIFINIIIGFLVVLGSWLAVQTILRAVLNDTFYQSWNKIDCAGERKGTTPGNSSSITGWIEGGIGQLKTSIPLVIRGGGAAGGGISCNDRGNCYNSQGVLLNGPESGITCDASLGGCFRSDGSAVNVNYVTSGTLPCSAPYVYTEDENGHWCQNPSNPDDWVEARETFELPAAGSVGSCAPSSAFGSYASAMSCVCGRESSGRVNLGSGVDRTINGEPYSWGLYQINLTYNEMRCPGQAPLNCPAAFQGRNNNSRIINQELYAKCVAAAQNSVCNENTAQYLLNNTPRGIRNWSTAGACGY